MFVAHIPPILVKKDSENDKRNNTGDFAGSTSEINIWIVSSPLHQYVGNIPIMSHS